MHEEEITLRPSVTQPTSRRSRKHWERVNAYKAKRQTELNNLLPETWDGQVHKSIESLQTNTDTGEATQLSTDNESKSNNGYKIMCAIM